VETKLQKIDAQITKCGENCYTPAE